MRMPLVQAVTLLAAATFGCGERADELGPYVDKLHGVDDYNARLVECRQYLQADEADKAADLRQTIEAYMAQLETFAEVDDKAIMAGHNSLKRTLDTSLKKIVEPDFPTFTISALKQIEIIEQAYGAHVAYLQKRWEEEGRTAPFTLAWPAAE